MKLNFVSFLIRLSVVILGLVSIIVCAGWYPFSISLTTVGFADVVPTAMQKVQFYSQLIFYWATTFPFFIFLICVWKVSSDIKYDTLSMKTLKNIRKGIWILFIDLIVFIMGNLIFLLLEWNDFFLVYFILAMVGFAFVCMLTVVLHFASRCVLFQEKQR